MSRTHVIAGSLLCLACSSSPAGATALHPALDLQGPGLAIAVGGAGLLGPVRSRELVVTVGGPIEKALLYWAGRDRPCPEDQPGSGRCILPETGVYKDQVLSFGGVLVTGTLIGSEAQPDTNAGPINNLGYFADVTDLVRAQGPGRRSYTVADGEAGSNLADLDGAGLLVIYTDPARTAPARVIVYHGLDFAYGEDRTRGDTEVTAPFTFNHGAARASARRGELVVFVGDAEAIGPDRIDISRNPSLSNRLDGSAGAGWDADRFPFTIPARAGATTVQIFSEPVGLNPDSLLWVAAALWLPLPVPTGCTADFWSRKSTSFWAVTGVRPEQLVRDAFRESVPYEGAGDSTLRTALGWRGGAGLAGAARDLIRSGVAALLNAGHSRLEYPWTRTQVITKVDTALRGRSAVDIQAAAHDLDVANGASCPLQ